MREKPFFISRRTVFYTITLSFKTFFSKQTVRGKDNK